MEENISSFGLVTRKSKGRRKRKSKLAIKNNAQENQFDDLSANVADEDNTENISVTGSEAEADVFDMQSDLNVLEAESDTNVLEKYNDVSELTGDANVVEGRNECNIWDRKNEINCLDNENEDELNSLTLETNKISMDAQMSAGPNPVEYEEPDKEEKIEDGVVVSKEEEIVTVEIPYNNRALSKHATTYELENFQKNALFIFNQENIDGYDEPRAGTQKDVDALTQTFEGFGFEVKEHTYKDLKEHEIFEKLKAFRKRDLSEYGCIGVAVLTHGSDGGQLRAKDRKYSEGKIINHLRVHDNPTIVTKAKFLIVQACRGPKISKGMPVFHSAQVRTDLDKDPKPYTLPEEADILTLHSSYAGAASFREEVNGSWLIQTLCKKIDQLAPTHDLDSIFTEVKREVAIDKTHTVVNRATGNIDINKQMPVSTSTLIRKLYLRRFGEVKPSDSVLREPEPTEVQPNSDAMTCASRAEVMDFSIPGTPLLPHFGPCSCFLDHFNYMTNCFKYFLEDNPDDKTAQMYLKLANTFEDEVKFNASKEEMLKLMHIHLQNNARGYKYFKFLYFGNSQTPR